MILGEFALLSARGVKPRYNNRAGKSLPERQKRVLEWAKDELRDVFGRT
jgi:Protein of unknown function (DUF3175)